jgi:hypothetical protein
MEFFMNKLTQTLMIVLLTILPVLSQIPTKGLVAWFPFNGNYNDESGSGIKLDSSAAGSPTLNADRNGAVKSSYEFDGARTTFKAIETNKLPSGNSDITISAWVFLKSGAPTCAITSWGTDTVGQKKEIVLYKTGKDGIAYVGITNGLDSITYKVPSNFSYRWSHVAVTIKSGSVKFFIDGVTNAAAQNMTFNIQTGGVFGIASDWRNSFLATNYFGGSMDDIAIYNRALTDQEIAYMFTCKSTKNSVPAITSASITTIRALGQYTYNVVTTDVDNQPVTLSLSKNPSGMIITGNKITWTPTNAQVGKNQICIIAKDVLGDSAIQAFDITVEPSTSITTKLITNKLIVSTSNSVIYLPNGRICAKKISNGLALNNGVKRIIMK